MQQDHSTTWLNAHAFADTNEIIWGHSTPDKRRFLQQFSCRHGVRILRIGTLSLKLYKYTTLEQHWLLISSNLYARVEIHYSPTHSPAVPKHPY